MAFRGAALIVSALDMWHANSKKLGDPELDNCPSHVSEGSNLTCLYRPSSSKPGTPRPVVTWTPKQAGDNQLHISNIQRESDNQTFTCYQYWGGWNDSDVRTVFYTVHLYSDENDDSPTVVVIASGPNGGLAVILIIVVIIIVKRQTGSEGNTAPRTVRTQASNDHQLRERRLPSQDSEGYTDARSAEPYTSDDEYMEPLPRRPQSSGQPRRLTGIWNLYQGDRSLQTYVHQGPQMDVVGQRSVYTVHRPGNRRLPNE